MWMTPSPPASNFSCIKQVPVKKLSFLGTCPQTDWGSGEQKIKMIL